MTSTGEIFGFFFTKVKQIVHLLPFAGSTSHIFVWKIAFVLYHIKCFPKSTRCFFLIGWAWEDLLTCKKTRACVRTCQLVQYKQINKICPFWARTTKVFVFRGYLSRVNSVFMQHVKQWFEKVQMFWVLFSKLL